ncbi:MAG: carbon-nitrogen hydrolase family protein [Vicinamibacteria bacterium]
MSSRTVVAAVCQMRSGEDVAKNLMSAETLVRDAATAGARFVTLPECMVFLKAEGEKAPEAQSIDGPWAKRFADLARELGITVLMGSFPETAEEAARPYNTTLLFGPTGERVAVYRKMHLFDIDLPGLEYLKESRATSPGTELVVADAGFAKLGLSICYDLRFPELYRALSARGAEVLLVPSAFTDRTGKDHWEVLLRARAIENLCYVMAPAQGGRHGPERASYGHAMIVDPWGMILAQVPDGEGFALAVLDFDRLHRLRAELPALRAKKL